MSMIKVRAKKDRIAYSAPRNGVLIPTDAFVSVQLTPWVQRLIDFHEDIIVEKEAEPKEDAKKKEPMKSLGE